MSHWPQYTMIIVSAIGFGLHWSRVGEPRKGTYDAFTLLAGPALNFTILYYGGFFAPLGWAP